MARAAGCCRFEAGLRTTDGTREDTCPIFQMLVIRPVVVGEFENYALLDFAKSSIVG